MQCNTPKPLAICSHCVYVIFPVYDDDDDEEEHKPNSSFKTDNLWVSCMKTYMRNAIYVNCNLHA